MIKQGDRLELMKPADLRHSNMRANVPLFGIER